MFGARSTGKTTLISKLFPSAQTLTIDLLDPETEDRLSRSPSLLRTILDQQPSFIRFIFIDEVQRQPRLLTLVHQYLQKHRERFHFLLSGSCARKLKHGGADLLAGRAFVYHLFPLTAGELDNDFTLEQYLNWGGLPEVYRFNDAGDRKKYLRTYALSYLKEEVWNEHLVKNLDPFRGFLSIAAQSSGNMLNFSSIARETGVSTRTVQQYFDILCESHLGFFLEPWHASIRKRFVQAPKFYFFDPGVKRALENTLDSPLTRSTYVWGRAFEGFIISQFFYLNHYLEKEYGLFYLRTKDGAEVDLVVVKPGNRLVLLEIKSAARSEIISTRNLAAFSRDLDAERTLVLSDDPLGRREDNIEFLHWSEGLSEVFS